MKLDVTSSFLPYFQSIQTKEKHKRNKQRDQARNFTFGGIKCQETHCIFLSTDESSVEFSFSYTHDVREAAV